MASQHPSPTSKNVIDVTADNFQREVVEHSMKFPVLVDFWADWCGPCKTLTPMLEQLAEEYRGAFRLAKVDTDKEQRLAMSFGVQSIPTVAILFDGRMVDTFTGAVPLADLRRMMDSLLEQLQIEIPQPEEPPVPTDPVLAAAHWEARLAERADDGEALLELGRLHVQAGRLEEAGTWLGKVEAVAPEYNAAQAVLKTMALLERVAAAGGEADVRAQLEADPTDPRARYLVACADASRGRFPSALATLVDLVASSPADVAADAKSAAATVFQAAGREDPEVEILRRKLARLLF